MKYTITSDDPNWEMVTVLVRDRDRIQKRYLRLRELVQRANGKIDHSLITNDPDCLKCLILRAIDFPEMDDEPEPVADPMVIQMAGDAQ